MSGAHNTPAERENPMNFAEMTLNEIAAHQAQARYHRYMSEDFRAADDRVAQELQREYETAAARAGWSID